MDRDAEIRWNRGKDLWFFKNLCHWSGDRWVGNWWVPPVIFAVVMIVVTLIAFSTT